MNNKTLKNTSVVSTVVREYDDIDTNASATEAEALAWLVGALYMIEDGAISSNDSTPTFADMQEYASTLGWIVTLSSGSV